MKGVTRNRKIAGISLRRLAEQKGFRRSLQETESGFILRVWESGCLLSRITVHRGVFRLDFASCRSSNVDRMWPGSRKPRFFRRLTPDLARVECHVVEYVHLRSLARAGGREGGNVHEMTLARRKLTSLRTSFTSKVPPQHQKLPAPDDG